MRRPPVDAIASDMRYLCRTIGNRLAGSAGEEKAARYIAGRFRELGLENVAILPFRCKRWIPGAGELVVLDPPPRHRIAAIPITHSASTPAAGIEGDLVTIEPIDYEEGLRCSGLRGKIGLFYGFYGESADLFIRLQNSPLRALLFVDTRLQTRWPIANGMGEKFMRLVRKPMACISSVDAWAIARRGVRRARLISTGTVVDGLSWNVCADLPGSLRRAKIIALSAHLDSVAVGAGADDDASGCVAVLEAARRLRSSKRLHTIRFLCFGAEEQLSVGSSRYVAEQVPDLDAFALVVNFDAVAPWIGRSEVLVTGTPALHRYVRTIVEQKLRFAKTISGTSPYQDAFPFAAKGIPGLWLTRVTHGDLSWYHHSRHNDLDACSAVEISRAAGAGCEIVADLARRGSWPFPKRISAPLAREIRRWQRELFDNPRRRR
ncbi:MAG: M20/M25/M40 family metallo-hydrolase [Planctomycetota bacterium]